MGRLVASGAEVERASGSQRIERHHHEAPYAALILRGGYVEAGDRGRIRAEAGNVLFHGAFEGHFDSIQSSGAEILNLPLASEPRFALGKCGDADAVVRLAVQDPASAAELLFSSTIPAQLEAFDWPDLLATTLCSDPQIRLDAWAAELGLSASAVSRGFAQAYGVTPKRYRLELKAAAAARAIRRGATLGDTAYATGFADQPHMTRAVASVFGRSPSEFKTGDARESYFGAVDRRSFLAASAAAAIAKATPAVSKRPPQTRTRWTVRESEGFDALSFLGPLSGDPFYLSHYEKEVAEFAPRMPASAMATLRALKRRAEGANILFSPFLDVRFSAGPDSSIEDLLASAADPDRRLLPGFRSSPYWDEEEDDWVQFKAALPALATILEGLKQAGFADFRNKMVAPKLGRLDVLEEKLARFDPIADAEFYTGRKFDPTIEIILLQFNKPHGIKVIGQRFLSAIDWSDDVHIRTAGHEILHPPVEMTGAAAKSALLVLKRDALLQRIVREHDPKFGYNSIEGIFDEDLTSTIDQLIAEKNGVARDPKERWRNVDGGMHVLAAALYGLMKQDGYARTGGNLEQWLLSQAGSGMLAPPALHLAAARILGRPADQLWPPPKS